MGLSYYYTLSAPADSNPADLKAFLHRVESAAQRLGFHPTMVLDASFDTPDRLAFARRLTTGLPLEDARLKNAEINDEAVWEHDPRGGTCHLLPQRGVFIVVTDEAECEIIFGFFQFLNSVKDSAGTIVAETNLDGRWHFAQFIDSPDPRFRTLVRMFAEAGFLESERDEYRLAPLPS